MCIDAASVHDERETLCIGFAGQWVVASRPIAPRRLASPRYASLEPDVTAARFIASVNLRRLTSRRVSGYLSTYPPTYLSIYPSAALIGRRAYQRTVPFVFRFISLREACARATHAPIETVTISRYALRYTRR